MVQKLKDLFKKLLYLPSKVDKDKLAHFFGSSILLFVLLLTFKPFIAYIIVLGSVAFKDFVWDRLWGKGKFEVLDIVFGALPVLIDIVNKL